jgi:hypothetical protein
MPMLNVFVKKDDGIHHFWGSELLDAPTDGQPHHVDLIWPLWNSRCDARRSRHRLVSEIILRLDFR